MASPRYRAARAQVGLSRRGLLLAGLSLGAVATAGLTGCSLNNPSLDLSNYSPAPRPTPTPDPPLPGATEGAELEQELADLASSLLAVGRSLGSARRAILTAARDGHLTHAIALRSSKPTDRPIESADGETPPATVKPEPPSNVAAAIKSMIKKERAAADSHLKSAAATTGLPALLWASMQSAACQYAQAIESKIKPGKAAATSPAELEPVTDIQAMQEMINQVHALLYGYQLAMGQFSLSSEESERAEARLSAIRTLRDQLAAQLVERSAEVPAAEPAYRPSKNPEDSAAAAELIMKMEVALQPFCGQWVAATTESADRKLAVNSLSACVSAAQAWGGPLESWPGWPG